MAKFNEALSLVSINLLYGIGVSLYAVLLTTSLSASAIIAALALWTIRGLT